MKKTLLKLLNEENFFKNKKRALAEINCNHFINFIHSVVNHSPFFKIK